jgi:Trypsin-like peptidase domain
MSLLARLIYTFLIAVTGMFMGEIAKSEETSIESSIVKIIQKGASEEIGTGFIVKVEQNIIYILTASHVVKGDSQPKVEFFAQRDRPVLAKKKGTENDDDTGLALIYITPTDSVPKGLRPLLIDLLELKNEDNLMAIGHPRMMQDWAPIKGHLSGRNGRNYVFNMPLHEGNSGGPVLRTGKVVALITQAIDNSVAYGVPASALLDFLKGNGIQIADSSDSVNAANNQNGDKCNLADPPITPCLFKEKK